PPLAEIDAVERQAKLAAGGGRAQLAGELQQAPPRDGAPYVHVAGPDNRPRDVGDTGPQRRHLEAAAAARARVLDARRARELEAAALELLVLVLEIGELHGELGHEHDGVELARPRSRTTAASRGK